MSNETVEKTPEQEAAEEAAKQARYALQRKRDRHFSHMGLLIDQLGRTTEAKEQGVLAGMLHREYGLAKTYADQLGETGYWNNRIGIFHDDED